MLRYIVLHTGENDGKSELKKKKNSLLFLGIKMVQDSILIRKAVAGRYLIVRTSHIRRKRCP